MDRTLENSPQIDGKPNKLGSDATLVPNGPDNGSHDSHANLVSEFLASAYHSGIQRPLESIGQLAGVKVEIAKTDNNLSGLMKASHVAGSVTGQIFDFFVLNRICGSAINKLVTESGTSKLALLTESKFAQGAATAGAVGFVNGALLTPLQDGESSFRRLGNGIVDAGSFAMLGGVGAKYANTFGENLTGRLKLLALAGGAGGATDSVLDPISHGRAPQVKEAALNTASWMFGSMITGEGLRGISKGFSASDSKPPLSSEASVKHSEVEPGRPGTMRDAHEGDFPQTIIIVPPADYSSGREPAAFHLDGRRYEGNQSAESSETSVKSVLKTVEPLEDKLQPSITLRPDGSTEWMYQDLPVKGDRISYVKSGDAALKWQIETAGGKIIDADTPGPWQVRYSDGSHLSKGVKGNLEFTQSRVFKFNGKSIETTETTELAPDHGVLKRKWQYLDPSDSTQTVTFKENGSWSATRGDGSTFNSKSDGPWTVSTLDGFERSKLPESLRSRSVKLPSSWRAEQEKFNSESLDFSPPQAIPLTPINHSPQEISRLPRQLWLTDPHDS